MVAARRYDEAIADLRKQNKAQLASFDDCSRAEVALRECLTAQLAERGLQPPRWKHEQHYFRIGDWLLVLEGANRAGEETTAPPTVRFQTFIQIG